MVRRNQFHRNELRRATIKRESDLDLSQTHGDYVPVPRADCTEREFYLPVDDEGTLRIDVRTWANERQVVDFSLTVRSLELVAGSWEWPAVAEVDICHGHAHLHRLKHQDDAPTHIMRVDTVDQVQEAYRASVAALQHFARILKIDKENGDE